MKNVRVYLSAALLAVTVVLTSCSESSPVAPVAAPQEVYTDADLLGLLSPTLNRIGLLSCRPMPRAEATARIGRAGGTITVGPHKLTIPRNALDRTVTIRAVAPTGRYNHIEFEPHGLEFDKSAALTMSYANCDVLHTLLPKHIAYTTERLQILYLLQSVDNVLQKKVTGKVDHFSDYVIAF